MGTLALAYKDRLCRIAYDLIADILIENSETKIIIENKSDQSFEQELADDIRLTDASKSFAFEMT